MAARRLLLMSRSGRCGRRAKQIRQTGMGCGEFGHVACSIVRSFDFESFAAEHYTGLAILISIMSHPFDDAPAYRTR